MTTISARRTFRKFTSRRTGFVTLSSVEQDHAGRLLGRLAPDIERVYIVGPRPGRGGIDGVRGWAATVPVPWQEDDRGHYLEGEHPVIRLAHPDGRRLELLRAAAYFGEGDYTAEDAGAAWRLLEEELRRGFDQAVTLLSSPAATGRELYLRSIPRGVEVETLDDEIQQTIRSTSGQGRIEVVAGGPAVLEELAGYDGRFMYAALCRELPTGPAVTTKVDDFLGYTRARYWATAAIPGDWRRRCDCGAPGHGGLGLLPFAEPDPRDGWSYPADPGRMFSGWWDGAEVMLALEHGWRFNYHSAIVWEERGDPLGGWARRLIAARDRLALLDRAGTNAAARLAAVGIRSILLHAIGAFYGAGHRVTRSVPIDRGADVPRDARDLRVEHDRIVWAEYQGAGWPALSHPEWSAAIWARARTRLLDCPTGMRDHRAGALHVDARNVVAMRTDAIYLSRDPRWRDDGAVGRLRRVLHRDGPLARPRSHMDVLELARGESDGV